MWLIFQVWGGDLGYRHGGDASHDRNCHVWSGATAAGAARYPAATAAARAPAALRRDGGAADVPHRAAAAAAAHHEPHHGARLSEYSTELYKKYKIIRR